MQSQLADRAGYLRLAETITSFLARLRATAKTLDVSERQRIVRLLVTYREGLADRWVERVVETWSDLLRP